jgi:hypothetical protein
MSISSHTNERPLPHLNKTPPAKARERLRGAVEGIAVGRFTQGNLVEVLKNGDEIFPAMLEALQCALCSTRLEAGVAVE